MKGMCLPWEGMSRVRFTDHLFCD